jgi:hypothetical protein
MNDTSTPRALTPPVNLNDRVRSLRLPDAPVAGRGGSKVSWIICGLLACTTMFFAVEAYAPVDDEMLKKLVDERLASEVDNGGLRLAVGTGR